MTAYEPQGEPVTDPNTPKFRTLPTLTPEDIDLLVGNPPDWYYLLIGKISAEMGLLESWTVRCAFHLHYDRAPNADEERFWLALPRRIATLVELAQKVESKDFASALQSSQDAATRRNRAVHALVNWSDERGGSGWGALHPRSGREVELDEAGQQSLTEDLRFIGEALQEMVSCAEGVRVGLAR